MLFSRAQKLQDGYAIQATSHFHQHNSNSEKRTLITGRQRFYLFSWTWINNFISSENPPVLADLFILWQKKNFPAPPKFRNLIICCFCFSTEGPEGGSWSHFPANCFFLLKSQLKSHNSSLSIARIEIPFPFFYCFSFMNPVPSAQNPISQPLKRQMPSSHFTPSRPS